MDLNEHISRAHAYHCDPQPSLPSRHSRSRAYTSSFAMKRTYLSAVTYSTCLLHQKLCAMLQQQAGKQALILLSKALPGSKLPLSGGLCACSESFMPRQSKGQTSSLQGESFSVRLGETLVSGRSCCRCCMPACLLAVTIPQLQLGRTAEHSCHWY